MRKLLNTLFVTSPDTYLALDGENVVVYREEETVLRVPLHTLEQILYFGYKGASPALMGACTDRGIRLAFLTPNGRFLAAACGKAQGNVLLRIQQVRASDDPVTRTRYARNFVFGKVFNSRWVLERTTRDHAMRVDVAGLKQVSKQMSDLLPFIRECTSDEQLRGFEGAAAEQYFRVFDQCILQNKKAFYFHGRNRRPPLDNVNALLSFVYTLLANDCCAALEAVGLDPYIGFLHRERPGRTSLALDLMEELRSIFADRFVLSLINNRVINNLKRKEIPYLRRTMGIVFQDFRLIERMTVYENVAFAMHVVGAAPRDIRKRVPYILGLVGLQSKAKCYPSELSGGEQQRVGLARALVNNPSLIIADEPTGNVDPALSFEIVDLLSEINHRGTTILMVTHEHNLVKHFNRRVIQIHHGEVVADTEQSKPAVAEYIGDQEGWK